MALNGTIDEWQQDELGRWYRPGHPEDGVITTDMPFADYWALRIADDVAAAAEAARTESFVADISRQEFIMHLKTDSLAQIETFVRNRINVDGVTDLASAKQCMKRMETGFVTLMKILALIAR